MPCMDHGKMSAPLHHSDLSSTKLCAQYNSYSTHYKEAECLRQMVEPFLYNYGVDIVMHGACFTLLLHVYI